MSHSIVEKVALFFCQENSSLAKQFFQQQKYDLNTLIMSILCWCAFVRVYKEIQKSFSLKETITKTELCTELNAFVSFPSADLHGFHFLSLH